MMASDQGLDYFVIEAYQVVVDAHQRTDFDAFWQISLSDLGEVMSISLYGLRGVRTCGLKTSAETPG